MRGSVAELRHGQLTLWTATQSPHIVRTTLSYVLPVAERDIRVVAPDVDGAFGSKTHVYPEEVLSYGSPCAWSDPCAGSRPRRAHGATCHAREHTIELEAAVGDDRERYGDDPDVRVGLGYATYLEGTTQTYFATTGHWTSYDPASLRVEPHGSVVVAVGVATTGQGTRSMVATLAADALGVPVSGRGRDGGHRDLPLRRRRLGSRSTVTGGGAVLKAAEPLRAKILPIAGHLLEADPEGLELADGRVAVKGSSGTATLGDVATAATVRTLDLPDDLEPGLESSTTFDPPDLQHLPDERGRMNGAAAWADASHAAIVMVDLPTGSVELLDYLTVHDGGPLVNPAIVDRQVVGGVAQGIGGACTSTFPTGGRAAVRGQLHGLPRADRDRDRDPADRRGALREPLAEHAPRPQGSGRAARSGRWRRWPTRWPPRSWSSA